ncbi:hypothetical protein RUMHYD_00457 [Blautia hydrogenotrophica DSM 10507]|uniref:Uncharacterized protein n=1 Tax=Blautia hydrogenotrophica (strain DSM 10507 / JCM 14656 / S5a33) TaxID=476272 RepID=C0CHZ3_BLAHS|nr:hypothetical protein RUMHYD_00457 [Blautia hydrogenotrophica DSM 10507]
MFGHTRVSFCIGLDFTYTNITFSEFYERSAKMQIFHGHYLYYKS